MVEQMEQHIDSEDNQLLQLVVVFNTQTQEVLMEYLDLILQKQLVMQLQPEYLEMVRELAQITL